MQIKAANNMYVCSEGGGGIYYAIGVAIRANRPSAFAWETYTLVYNDDGTVSIKTADGFYWTAEEGGGGALSTNRNTIGPWERFIFDGSSFLCWDRKHWVSAELGGGDPILVANRTQKNAWETFECTGIPTPVDPANIPKFKGDLCGFLPNLRLAYAPNGVFFTPAYVVYDTDTRARIRDLYRNALGYTHFPINLTNHSSVYGSFYPAWDDTRINQFLGELLKDGLLPVGFAMGDHDTEVTGYASADLVPIVVPKWEDEKPLKKPALDNDNTFYLTQQRYPKAAMYWHNPAYQGAPFVDYADWGLPQGDPGINGKVWHYMVDTCGVKGLLFQGRAWETGGVNRSIAVLGDFHYRLGLGNNGWPKGEVQDYEETAYYVFNLNGNPTQALSWTKQIRSNAVVNGWCNG